MTQTFKTGPVYALKEIGSYMSLNSKSVFKVIKEKIIIIDLRSIILDI